MRWALIVCLILPLANTAAAAAACPSGPIRGLLYQPHAADLAMNSAQWEARFTALQSMGVSRLLLQWTNYAEFDFIEAATADESDFLLLIGDLADRHGIDLKVGLASDPAWFEQARRQNRDFDTYLTSLRADALAQAQQLMRQYPDLKFSGWYLPEEISDGDWETRSRQLRLIRHVFQLARDLRAIRPDSTVTISSFASGAMTPDQYTNLLLNLQQQVRGLRILHQDGSGTGLLNSRERRAYVRDLSNEMNTEDWSVITELFRQQSATDAAFTARPASIEELAPVVELRRRANPELEIVGFSLRYLFDNDSVLYNGYMQHYCQSNPL